MIKGNTLSEYTDHQTPQTGEKGDGSRELVSCTGFSIQALLDQIDQNGNIDFKILIRFLEKNQVSVSDFFEKEEHIKQILFPFFNFLHTSFSEKKHIPQNIIDILENQSSVRDGVLSYIEERTPYIKLHIDQYDIIDFHLFLLGMNQDFDLVKDIQLDHFIKINALFADSAAKVSQLIGNIHVWTSRNLPEVLVRELSYCKQLGETINKLALIHAGNFEERQISFNLGLIIRTNINALLRQLDSGFAEKHIIIKKLRNLSGKVQVNFEHGIPIRGTIAQIDEIYSHTRQSQREGFSLQEEGDFGQDNKDGKLYIVERKVSEMVLSGNGALAELIRINQIEKIQGHDSQELRERKLISIRDIIHIYSYATGKQLETIEEIFADIDHNGIENEFQIEALYYILLYNNDIKEEFLERLMIFFLSDESQTHEFFYEQYEGGSKIIALIIRKFHPSEEQHIQLLPLVEQVSFSLKEKEVSRSILNYSKVYLSLALFYIGCKGKEYIESAQICFGRYKDLSAGLIGINENFNVQDEKEFLIALGRKDEMIRYGKSFHDNEELEKSGAFVFGETMENFQLKSILSIEGEVRKITTSMNHGDDVYSQNQINDLLGKMIAKTIFYNICTITVIGDCGNCESRNESCNTSISTLGLEKCFLISGKRGFQRKDIPLALGVSIIFTYPSASENIFKKIFSEQHLLIEEHFGNLIEMNHKNERLRKSKAELERLAFYDTPTGLPNKNSLLSDLEKLDSTKPFLLLLKFDQVTDISDGFGFDKGDILIKKIAEMLETLNIGIIYRTGGSEFGIIMTHDMENKGLIIEDCTRKLIDKIIKTQILLPGNELFHVTPTIGIVQSDGTRMYDKAHTALQDARRVGMGEFKLYEEGVAEAKIQRELLIKSELSVASKTGQVMAHYQWIRDNYNPNNSIKKHEALMRVPGFSPGEFIEVAKKHGLLPELTKKVIKDVLQAAQENNDQFSINITEENLRDPDFIGDFREGLKIYNIPATRICIEVTEDVINIDTEYMKKLEILDQMGCEFSIDDFGAKHSGWDRLVQLKGQLKNFRYLKIDGLFIKDIDTNPDHYSIVKGTTEIAHNLGLKVVAEFVSTEAIQKKIEELGIDYSQGFLFSKPAEKIMK